MSAVPTLASRVHIADEVVFRDLEGGAVLLNLESGVYFGLDPVGTRIWQLLREHGGLEEVLTRLLEEYEVERAQGEKDLLDLVVKLSRNGLIEIVY